MRILICSTSFMLIGLCLPSSHTLAQHNESVARVGTKASVYTTSSVTARVNRKIDSLQRLTQAGYYTARFTQRKAATGSETARKALSTCDSYLCGLVNGEVVSIQLGEWNDPAIWSVKRVPTRADVVRIRHRVSVPVNYNAQAKRLRYDVSGKLVPATGSRVQLGQ